MDDSVVALTREQRRVAADFARAVRTAGAGHRLATALYEAGLVEAGLRNPNYGDRDSLGSLQQRASWAPAASRLDPYASALRFLTAGKKVLAGGFHGGAGRLAQAVQVSAYPGRYAQRHDEAVAIERRFLGGGGAGGPSGARRGPSGGLLSIPGVQGAQGLPMGSSGIVPLLQALQDRQRPQAPSAGLASPSFAAQPTLAGGGQAPVSGGGPAPKPDMRALLDLVQSTGGDVQLAPGNAGGTVPLGGAAGAGGAGQQRLGRVTVAPGANRPGTRINPRVVGFVRQVAGMVGHPLTIGTGTNHSRLTINGTVSDHWSGNGADVPLTGKALVRAGQDALIAAGMAPAKARRITGGGFNVGGWQIIFNTDAPGWGDHTTHLHIGRRVR